MFSSSPFGLRCTGIHDPRVSDENRAAWLPHSEVSVTSLCNTTANVDRFYHKRVREVHQINPLLYSKKCNIEWTDTYNQVCNIPFESSSSSIIDISDLQRMKMVYCMMKEELSATRSTLMDYIYHPTHVLYDEVPCMALMERYFDLSKEGNDVVEISHDQYFSSMKKNFSLVASVRLLVFGPHHEPSTEPASLWFNIPQDEFVIISATQAKRSKRNKTKPSMVTPIKKNMTIPPFYLAQPMDHYANTLLLHIYQHRIQVLSSERLQDTLLHDATMTYLTATFTKIHARLQRFHSWPVQKGREVNDEDTALPHCSQEYNFDGGNENLELWNSLIKSLKKHDNVRFYFFYDSG